MQQRSSDERIDKMFSTDRLWAYGAVIALWATYLFVFWEVYPNTHNDDVVTALLIAGTLVLVFNTAAILAMINHYAHDKEHIYGLDIRYLDIMNKKS